MSESSKESGDYVIRQKVRSGKEPLTKEEQKRIAEEAEKLRKKYPGTTK